MNFAQMTNEQLLVEDERLAECINQAGDNSNISELIDESDAVALEIKRRHIMGE